MNFKCFHSCYKSMVQIQMGTSSPWVGLGFNYQWLIVCFMLKVAGCKGLLGTLLCELHYLVLE